MFYCSNFLLFFIFGPDIIERTSGMIEVDNQMHLSDNNQGILIF